MRNSLDKTFLMKYEILEKNMSSLRKRLEKIARDGRTRDAP